MLKSIFSFIKSNYIVVPVFSGVGVFFIALSYEPSNENGWSGPVGPDVDPFHLGIGVTLLIAAIVKYRDKG